MYLNISFKQSLLPILVSTVSKLPISFLNEPSRSLRSLFSAKNINFTFRNKSRFDEMGNQLTLNKSFTRHTATSII